MPLELPEFAIHHLNLTIVLELRTGDNELKCWVAAPGAQLQKAFPSGISQAIRAALCSAHTIRLLSMSQGRAFFLLSLSPASSHFFRTGSNTNFSEWYFIMRARLDLHFCGSRHYNTHLPACCNRCQFPVVMLQHILNICPASFHLYTKRHDSLVIRVARALIWT